MLYSGWSGIENTGISQRWCMRVEKFPNECPESRKYMYSVKRASNYFSEIDFKKEPHSCLAYSRHVSCFAQASQANIQAYFRKMGKSNKAGTKFQLCSALSSQILTIWHLDRFKLKIISELKKSSPWRVCSKSVHWRSKARDEILREYWLNA